MKNILTLAFITMLISVQPWHLKAQPGKFNYQAVIRDASTGNAITTPTIAIRFQIFDAMVAGTQVYQEDFPNQPVNSYGVVNLQIGTNPSVPLKSLNWGLVNYYVNIQMGPSPSGPYTDISSNRTALVSVPYSLFASKSDTSHYAMNIPTIVPPGTIVAFGGNTPPPGWLLCDSGSYSTTGPQAALFAAIGYNFGGSGSTFTVPDLRGRFLRGVDGFANHDPDKASRIAIAPGGQTGNNVGSLQHDDFESHKHAENAPNAGGGGAWTFPAAAAWTSSGQVSWGGVTTDNTGGNETRPKNVYVNFIIKY